MLYHLNFKIRCWPRRNTNTGGLALPVQKRGEATGGESKPHTVGPLLPLTIICTVVTVAVTSDTDSPPQNLTVSPSGTAQLPCASVSFICTRNSTQENALGLRSTLRIKRGGSWRGSAEMCLGVNGQKALALLTSLQANAGPRPSSDKVRHPPAQPPTVGSIWLFSC